MFSKIAGFVKKYSFVIFILHTVMLFISSFARGSARTGEIVESHSVVGMLISGIRPFWAFIFILSVVVALLSSKVLAQLFSKELAVILQSGCVIVNLIVLFILRSGYMRYAIPLGMTAFGFWYYLIFDILLIIASLSIIADSDS